MTPTRRPRSSTASCTSTCTARSSPAASCWSAAPRPPEVDRRARSGGCWCTSTTSTPAAAGMPSTTRGRYWTAVPTTRSRPSRRRCGRAGFRAGTRSCGSTRVPGARRPPTGSWPNWTPGQSAPVSGRRRPLRVLAEGGPRPRPGLGPPLAQCRRRPGRDPLLRRPRPRRGAGAGSQPRRGRTPPVDLTPPRRPRTDLGAHRHRPGRTHRLRRRPRAGPPLPHRTAAPGAPGHTQGHRATRDPDRPRPRLLGVARRPATRPCPPRLHPERDQQDPRGAVQPPPRATRACLDADLVGAPR